MFHIKTTIYNFTPNRSISIHTLLQCSCMCTFFLGGRPPPHPPPPPPPPPSYAYNSLIKFINWTSLMLNILLIADIVSKIISLVIFVCLAMWSIRNLKDHDVSYATALLRQVIKTIVSKGLLYFTGGPAKRSIIWSIIGTITPNAYWSRHTVIDQSPRPLVRPMVRLMFDILMFDILHKYLVINM